MEKTLRAIAFIIQRNCHLVLDLRIFEQKLYSSGLNFLLKNVAFNLNPNNCFLTKYFAFFKSSLNLCQKT